MRSPSRLALVALSLLVVGSCGSGADDVPPGAPPGTDPPGGGPDPGGEPPWFTQTPAQPPGLLGPEVPSAPLFHPRELRFRTDGLFHQADSGAPGSADPNPWLHYRLSVVFDHAQLASPITVPGFFAGDGEGGPRGSVWKARFTPELAGAWTYVAYLEAGPSINVRSLTSPGELVPLTPADGVLEVTSLDPDAPGFLSQGVLRHDPSAVDPYWRFSGPGGERFLQVGVGSPENFLAYDEFTGAQDSGSGSGFACCCRETCYADCNRTLCIDSVDLAPGFLHRYQAHVADHRPGDPTWELQGQPGAGRGIIGALNFLGDLGVNSLYALVMNLGGDGKDTHPFHLHPGPTDCPREQGAAAYDQTLNYHVKRMEEWNTVLGHAQQRGILVQLLLAEQEACNIRWFGPHDAQGVERNHDSVHRRLFLKQMVAWFGHHPGLRWNLCEENKDSLGCLSQQCGGNSGPALSPPQFSAAELEDMAAWIRSWDAHRHPIGFHTEPNSTVAYEEVLARPLGREWFTATSLQVHDEGSEGARYGRSIEELRALLDQYGISVPLICDEQGSPVEGLAPQGLVGAVSTATAEDRRKRVLYDVLLSGGQLSYYFGIYQTAQGGGDLRTEDFGSRGTALAQAGFAQRVITSQPRWWTFQPRDERLVGLLPFSTEFGGPELFAAPDLSRALVYYPTLFRESQPTAGSLDLSGFPGSYTSTWIDPRNGQTYPGGAPLQGGANASVPLPDLDENGVPGDSLSPANDLLLLLVRSGS